MRRLGSLIRGLPLDSALVRALAEDREPPAPARRAEPTQAARNLAFAQRYGVRGGG